jgi:hypothetical protein
MECHSCTISYHPNWSHFASHTNGMSRMSSEIPPTFDSTITYLMVTFNIKTSWNRTLRWILYGTILYVSLFTSGFISFWIPACTTKHNIDSFKLFYASEYYYFISYLIQLHYYSATNYNLEYSELVIRQLSIHFFL